MAYTPTAWANGNLVTPALLNKVEAALALFDTLAYNVKDTAYAGGAKGNNSTSDDDLAAIQAAIDACTAAGGGIVFVPEGTYYISGRLDVKANVILQGAGVNATTIKSLAAATNPSVRMRGDNNVTVQDLTVDVNSRASSIGIVIEPVSTATIASQHSILRCRVKNATSNAVRVPSNPSADFTVENSIFEDCGLGVSIYEVTGQVHYDIRVVGNKFRRVGTNNIQLNGSNAHSFSGVTFTDNELRDFTTPSTAIPIECNYADNAVVSRNKILTAATRGISCGACYDLTISNNTIKAQTVYAIELNNVKGFSITGNTVRDCASFAHETNTAQTEDGVISGNSYIGSGATGTVSGGNAIKLPWAKRLRIANNLFSDWQYLREAIRVGEAGVAEDVTVEDNTFIVNDANTPLWAVNLRSAIRSSAVRNTIRIKRNLVAGDDFAGAIKPTIDAGSSDLLIEGNDIIFSGTVAAATNAAGINNDNVAAGALTRTTIRNNRVVNGPRGLRLVINSTDLIVEGNYTSTCSNPDVIPTTAGRGYEVGPQWFPTYRAASYYFCNSPSSTGTPSATLGNGNFRSSPWIITKPVTITRIGAEFTVAGDAASVFRIGIYRDDGFGVPTGAALLDAGSISTGTGNAGTVATAGTPGAYEITVSQTLQPGVYWVGGAVQGVTVTQPTMRVTAASSHVAPVPSTAIPSANAAFIGWTLTGQTGALGTWSGTTTNGAAPARIFFKTT